MEFKNFQDLQLITAIFSIIDFNVMPKVCLFDTLISKHLRQT